MNLGTTVEIKLKSKNIDKSMSFYEYLGFRKIGDDVIGVEEHDFSSQAIANGVKKAIILMKTAFSKK